MRLSGLGLTVSIRHFPFKNMPFRNGLRDNLLESASGRDCPFPLQSANDFKTSSLPEGRLFTITLFSTQRLHRVRYGCFYCLETYRHKGNNQGGQSTSSKYPPTYVDAKSIILQPLVHVIPC